MENVIIKINKLGAVTNSEITLRPFIIFTGESGLGKSYVAFLTHYIYTIASNKRLSRFLDQYDFKELLKGAKDGDKIFEITASEVFNWINKDAIEYIGYLIGHDSFNGDIEIIWPFKDKVFEFIYSEEMAGLSNEEEVIYRIQTANFTYKILSDISKIDTSVFETLICAELSNAVFGNISFSEYILPPSRGALMELNERPAFRSGMYDEFFNLKAALVRPTMIKKSEDLELERILQKIYNGKLTQSDNEITYITSDGVPMPLSAAASSVKELAPFTMMLNKFAFTRTSVLFEEPEAHLHPQRQQHVADAIGYALSKGIHMQITTHSDYFIKRLNLLIKLFNLTKESTPVKLKDILQDTGININSFINPEHVAAYHLAKREDGTTAVEEFNVMEEGSIPFTTFYDTITNEFEINSRIKSLFESSENEE